MQKYTKIFNETRGIVTFGGALRDMYIYIWIQGSIAFRFLEIHIDFELEIKTWNL